MNPVEKNYLKELLEYIGLDLRMDGKGIGVFNYL